MTRNHSCNGVQFTRPLSEGLYLYLDIRSLLINFSIIIINYTIFFYTYINHKNDVTNYIEVRFQILSR